MTIKTLFINSLSGRVVGEKLELLVDFYAHNPLREPSEVVYLKQKLSKKEYKSLTKKHDDILIVSTSHGSMDSKLLALSDKAYIMDKMMISDSTASTVQSTYSMVESYLIYLDKTDNVKTVLDRVKETGIHLDMYTKSLDKEDEFSRMIWDICRSGYIMEENEFNKWMDIIDVLDKKLTSLEDVGFSGIRQLPKHTLDVDINDEGHYDTNYTLYSFTDGINKIGGGGVAMKWFSDPSDCDLKTLRTMVDMIESTLEMSLNTVTNTWFSSPIGRILTEIDDKKVGISEPCIYSIKGWKNTQTLRIVYYKGKFDVSVVHLGSGEKIDFKREYNLDNPVSIIQLVYDIRLLFMTTDNFIMFEKILDSSEPNLIFSEISKEFLLPNLCQDELKLSQLYSFFEDGQYIHDGLLQPILLAVKELKDRFGIVYNTDSDDVVVCSKNPQLVKEFYDSLLDRISSGDKDMRVGKLLFIKDVPPNNINTSLAIQQILVPFKFLYSNFEPGGWRGIDSEMSKKVEDIDGLEWMESLNKE